MLYMPFQIVLLEHFRSILFSYTIKSLTNSTDSINISSRVGYGISYSIWEETETEIAYQVLR